jgi:hypothetical protein
MLKALHNPGPWVSPEPRDLPVLRHHLAEHLLTPAALEHTAFALDMGLGSIRPVAHSALEAATVLHAEEYLRLASANLYYLTPEMTQLALAAGRALPDWTTEPTDLPSPDGFMLFSQPTGAYRNDEGDRVRIVACSWGRSEIADPTGDGAWITFWSVTNHPLLEHLLREFGGLSEQDAYREARRRKATLGWDDEVLLPWGPAEVLARPARTPTPGDDPTFCVSTQEWTQTLRAAWLLTQQRTLAPVTEQHAPRSDRRRAERAGRTLPPVRVVSIHRTQHCTAPSGHTDSGRQVSVRFPVEGHWREQAYGPNWTLRRRRWIPSHWKGPVNGPVRIRPKVNLVASPPSDE